MGNKPNRPFSPDKLPARANLEHLKNEAKQRLKVMRLRNAAARLFEAQLLVARGYGFPSWRKMKSYVDALNHVGKRLISAIRDGDLKTMGELLDRYPELVNANTEIDQRALMPVDYTGAEAKPREMLMLQLLHLAIVGGKIDALRLLIERGADVNARNADGRLPLHDCFELGHDDFAKVLLDAGAVPDVCAAAAYGMYDRLRQILRNDPAEANDLTTGESPLGWAIYGRQPVSATILFEHGAIADHSPYDSHAWRPAAMVASTAVVPILLQHGANPNWRDMDGDTPLHCVLKSRIVLDPTEFVKILLAAGADASLRNADGRRPLDEALLQQSKKAETYFPVRTIGPKKLEQTIEILQSRVAQNS